MLEERDGAVYITAVSEGSAADEAGLEPGDYILAVSGEGIGSVEAFTRLAGSGARIKCLRNGETLTFVLPEAP